MASEEATAAPAAGPTATAELAPDWIEKAVIETGVPEEKSARQYMKDVFEEYIQNTLLPGQVVSPDVETNINYWIGEIDRKLTAQMNEILHHPAVQKLEGTWRGLHYLVKQSETSPGHLELRVLNATKEEVAKDLEKAVEFDQSQTFKKVYEEEYGQLGGFPYGMLMGDYDFDVRRSADMKLLSGLSGVAAAAHAPFVAAVSPETFGMKRFSELSDPRDLATKLVGPEFAMWKSFRESDDSRYVALTCPRVLAREVYGEKFSRVEEFNFEENVDGTEHDKYLWMSSAWAYAARVTDAYAQHGWMGRTRGVDGGGKVEGLPVHTFRTSEGDVALKCPTEVAITDRREKELEGLGFMSLVHCKGRDFAAFMSAASTQKPLKYANPDAGASAFLSTRFNQLMCVSRFAHFLKVMVRNRIGMYMERLDMERWLNKWINFYTLGNPETATEEAKAQKPLKSASITVQDVPGQPGSYKAVAHLVPHFQLEELEISLRMTARQVGAA